MRGLVFDGNREVSIREFPDPTPGPDEVIIEIKASGMCGSDLKFYRDPPGSALASFGFDEKSQKAGAEIPAIIGGHEPCGVIVEVGSNVDPNTFAVGDRVMQFHYKGCDVCEFCRTGWNQMCERGAKIYGASAHGGHSNLMAAPASTLVHLPDDVSFVAGAAIACGTGTAYGAIRKASITGMDTVAIFGLGPIGLSAVQFTRALGCEPIVIDISPDRLKAAQDLGAIHAINGAEVDPIEAIRDLTDGHGVTAALDVSGSPVARSQATQSLQPWGRLALVGLGGDYTVDAGRDLILKQVSVFGSYTFSSTGMADCARFVARHGVDVDAIFTDKWTLDQGAEAYREFDKQTRGKAVIEF
ncbi:zinc-dependent alcohol dehydrogenase family protein [Brevibacterium sp. VCM10]|uniref:zinc-dependent alcohol dehydrogenase family protein n=1 Tax=Brevibacterium sp. VCM10 TaxID=1381751 RepID=UPI0004721C34|nr:zinc-binding dehydrogenase [Brevibacterium sp. VCM10]